MPKPVWQPVASFLLRSDAMYKAFCVTPGSAIDRFDNDGAFFCVIGLDFGSGFRFHSLPSNCLTGAARCEHNNGDYNDFNSSHFYERCRQDDGQSNELNVTTMSR